MGPRDRKILNNLVLGKSVNVQKQYKSQIRAGIHNLKYGRVPPREAGAYAEGLRGRIGYLRLFDPRRASAYDLELNSAVDGLRPVSTNGNSG